MVEWYLPSFFILFRSLPHFFLCSAARFLFKLAMFRLKPLPFIFIGFPRSLLFHLAALFFFCCFAPRLVCRAFCLPPAPKDHDTSNNSGRNCN
jgi:hypothetical protein